ncbi:hypothetical protein D3C76_1499660 [compost metagenome]
MLRTNTRIIKSGRDGMRWLNLSILILQQVTHRSLEYTMRTFGHRRSVILGFDPFACGFNTNKLHILITDKWIEHTDRITSSTHGCYNHIWQTPFDFLNLTTGLITNHTLEIPHHHRIWMRTNH